MSGFGNADGFTPGRRTVVRLNKFLPVVISPMVAIGRDSQEMAADKSAQQSHVEYVPAIGFRLKDHLLNPQESWEKAYGRILDASNSSVAPNHSMLAYNRTYGDTGLVYAGADSQSAFMFQKQVPAGGSWEQRLSADETSYAGPTDTTWITTNLDRVLVSNASHEPNDGISTHIWLPQGRAAGLGAYAQIYFCGPAGGNGDGVGIGQYCLRVAGGGRALLFEKLTGGTWLKRKEFDLIPLSENSTGIALTILSDAALDAAGHWVGSTIAFIAAAGDSALGSKLSLASTLIETLTTSALAAISKHTSTYRVPKQVAANTALAPIRLDVRRDARAIFGVSQSTYELSGTIVDASFVLPTKPVGAAKFKLDWFGDRPAGTSIVVKLYDDSTGAEVTPATTSYYPEGQVLEYSVPASKSQHYHVKFEMAGDGTKTPTLSRWQFYRPSIVETPAATEVLFADDRVSGATLPTMFHVRTSISGPSEQIGTDSAQVTVADLTGQAIPARWRTGTPIDVEVWDTSGNLISTIFHGVTGPTTVDKVGRDGRLYPTVDATRITYDVAGEWTRLSRRLSPARLTFYDDAAKLPMKVTDAIAILLGAAGYDVAQVDVPDLPIRMWGDTGQPNDLMVEPSVPLGPIIQQLCEDYFGATLAWDPNAGSMDGMWRFIRKASAPFNVLMRFHIAHPGALKIVHSFGSYPITNNALGHPISPNYVIGQPKTRYEPAEGNCVSVFGGGNGEDGNRVRLARTLYNVASYNAMGLAPAHANYPNPDSPDYLGECVQIEVYDGTLNTQEAVDWVARRVFDAACFGREYVTIDAPLRFVVDLEDPYQVRARPLRFGDVVELEQPDGSWVKYAVARVSPAYENDNAQRATYELVTAVNFETVGLLPSQYDLHSLTRARIRAAKRAMGEPDNTRLSRVGNRRVNVSLWMANPVIIPGLELQDLDPESPTFGSFVAMSGYDAGII